MSPAKNAPAAGAVLATATFDLEKETKGAYRFKESVADGEQGLIGTVYIRKTALSGPAPARITVVISAATA